MALTNYNFFILDKLKVLSINQNAINIVIIWVLTFQLRGSIG